MQFKNISMGRKIFVIAMITAAFAMAASAQAIERSASGDGPASIQAAVDQFRNDLGQLNPNSRQSFRSGRREINWDGVPEGGAAPNLLQPDFFNFNSPRGVMFSSTAAPQTAGAFLQAVQVSSSIASGIPVRFGNINPQYTTEFQVFSAQRLFTTSAGSNVLEIAFFIPGTTIPATVNGFGSVFTDVDTANTRMLFYDTTGRLMLESGAPVPAADKGLSFQGVSFNDGRRIARVVIVLGNAALSAKNTDGVDGVDVVAMDDFIYGEPRAIEHHAADFDGDGAPDLSVYRPSVGQWFVLNSGSNTVSITQFGLDGDIPVDGDFDGDKLSDIALYRPSTGTWFRLNSSDGQFSAINFGLAEDKPVVGDYDKDGKSDIAVWRPSTGDYFSLKSSTGQFQAIHWGLPGDIPLLGAAQ